MCTEKKLEKRGDRDRFDLNKNPNGPEWDSMEETEKERKYGICGK